jgi:hypothetical protein
MTREQLTTERQTALIEALVAEGILPPDWRTELNHITQPGDGREVVERARNGDGPRSDPPAGSVDGV